MPQAASNIACLQETRRPNSRCSVAVASSELSVLFGDNQTTCKIQGSNKSGAEVCGQQPSWLHLLWLDFQDLIAHVHPENSSRVPAYEQRSLLECTFSSSSYSGKAACVSWLPGRQTSEGSTEKSLLVAHRAAAFIQLESRPTTSKH